MFDRLRGNRSRALVAVDLGALGRVRVARGLPIVRAEALTEIDAPTIELSVKFEGDRAEKVARCALQLYGESSLEHSRAVLIAALERGLSSIGEELGQREL